MACGNALNAGGELALPSWDNLGRLEDTFELEDCLRLPGGLCAAGSGRTTAEEMGLRQNQKRPRGISRQHT
jgi:hypothetical protein